MAGIYAQDGLRRFNWRNLDFDNGVVSVPNTGVWTEVFTLTSNNRFFWNFTRVTVYDAAAIPILQWRAFRNGQPVGPYGNQRAFSYLAQRQEVYVKDLMFALEKLSVEVLNPATAPAAFDVLGSINGAETRTV